MSFTPRGQTAKLVVAVLVSLTVGYLAGREHVKYEMRTAFASAAEELQKGFASIFSGDDSTGSASASPAAPVRSEPAPAPASQPILATLTAKDFRPSNVQAGVFDDGITFSLELLNRTGQDVRAFEGALRFYDLLDNAIVNSKLTITDPLKADEQVTWRGELDYNQFNAAHQRLAGEKLENLKVQFAVSKILFADGTSQEF